MIDESLMISSVSRKSSSKSGLRQITTENYFGALDSYFILVSTSDETLNFSSLMASELRLNHYIGIL